MSYFDDNEDYITGKKTAEWISDKVCQRMDDAYKGRTTRPVNKAFSLSDYKATLRKIETTIKALQYNALSLGEANRLRDHLEYLLKEREHMRRTLGIKGPNDFSARTMEKVSEDLETMEQNGKAAIATLAKSIFGKEGTKLMATKMKLYEIILQDPHRVVYGNKLTTNSKGEWVMELKGDGGIVAVHASAVKEVLPHTIAVQVGAANMRHMKAPVGKFAPGEIYLTSDLALCKIVEVDTKSRNVSETFRPIAKLEATPLEWPVTDDEDDEL